VGQQVIVLIVELNTLHGDSDHLCARDIDGTGHELVVVELSCTQEQAGTELTPRNN